MCIGILLSLLFASISPKAYAALQSRDVPARVIPVPTDVSPELEQQTASRSISSCL